MSNFLSSLAARSLGLAEVVRPRVASLFEPPQAAAASNMGMLGSLFEKDRGEPEARPPELAVPPATRPHALSRASPPSTMRTSDAGTIRRSSESSPETYLALVPHGARGSEDPSTRPGSESRWPANGHFGALRDLGPVAVLRRPAVSPAIERDGEARSPAAAAGLAGQPHDLLPVLPSSVVRPSETDVARRSGHDAAATRPARVSGRADDGETALSAARPEPVRHVKETMVPAESGPSGPSRGEPIAPPGPGTAGPVRVVVEPRVALYTEPAGPAHPRPAVRGEPTIQVTIGRVEVRATHPAAPVTPRERQRPAAMSLEEYLSRRAEGSAR